MPLKFEPGYIGAKKERDEILEERIREIVRDEIQQHMNDHHKR